MSVDAAPSRLVTLLLVGSRPMTVETEAPTALGTLARGGGSPSPEHRPSRPRRPVTRRTSRLAGTAFAAAWITCVAIEPVPDGPEPAYPMWLLPIDLVAISSIVAACIALWMGSRWGAKIGVVAGAGMIAETATCPLSGHHLVGWFIVAQAAMSVAVLAVSVAMVRRAPHSRRASPAAPGRAAAGGRRRP